MNHSSTLLVADIGGTNIRLAHCTTTMPKTLVTPSDTQNLKCTNYPTLLEAIQHYCSVYAIQPQQICLAIAGPVRDNYVQLTNNHWQFEKSELQQQLGVDNLLCINDFTAQAWASAHFLEDRHRQQQPAPPIDQPAALQGLYHANTPPTCDDNVLIIGPGTGLGVSALIYSSNGEVIVVEGEGGHIGITPQNEDDIALIRWLWQQGIPLTYESIISGTGLENIYRFNTDTRYSAVQIAQAALEGDIAALRSIHMMFGHLGKASADMILGFGAWGGLVLAGGVCNRLKHFVRQSPLAENLYQHADMARPLQGLPIYLLSHPMAGLIGAQRAYQSFSDEIG